MGTIFKLAFADQEVGEPATLAGRLHWYEWRRLSGALVGVASFLVGGGMIVVSATVLALSVG